MLRCEVGHEVRLEQWYGGGEDEEGAEPGHMYVVCLYTTSFHPQAD